MLNIRLLVRSSSLIVLSVLISACHTDDNSGQNAASGNALTNPPAATKIPAASKSTPPPTTQTKSSVKPTSDTQGGTHLQFDWTAPTMRQDGDMLQAGALRSYDVVYYSKTNQAQQHSVKISDPTTTTYVSPPLPSGTYFFKVRGVDAWGNASDFSPALQATL